MKKKVMIGIAGVIIVIAGVVVALLSHLGAIIKTAVNTYGPAMTKTEVRLSDVDISLLSARAEIKGFYLGNPESFTSPKAMAVGSIYVDVDEKSLTSDPLIIERIEVRAPDITYEKRGGTDNFRTILNNIKEKTGTHKGSEGKAEEKGEGRRIIIRDVIIRDGKITLATAMLGGKEITVPLPEIHLTDIGEKEGGASPAEVAREIVAKLYERITAPAVIDALNDQLKKLGSSVEAVGSEVTKQAKDLGGKLKSFLGKEDQPE